MYQTNKTIGGIMYQPNNTIELDFNFDNNRPIYIQLVEQLEVMIISGKLPPASKLPSVRELATKARVNPNTIQRALAELERKKLIYTERTNGKFVSKNLARLVDSREAYITHRITEFVAEMHALGLSERELIRIIKEGGKNG